MPPAQPPGDGEERPIAAKDQLQTFGMFGLFAATEGDPRTGLRAVRALRRLVEQLEASQVALAREQGWSWQDVADALGVSRQAVHKKHRRT